MRKVPIPSPAALTITHKLYVDKSGDDTLGICNIIQPCLTIQKALSLVTDSSSINRYAINVGPGIFDEVGNILLLPWTWIIGTQRTLTTITSSTNITGLSTQFSIGNFRAGLKDVTIGGSTNVYFDLQTIGGVGSTIVEMRNVFINNLFTFKSRTTLDGLRSWSCQWSSSVILMAGQFSIFDSYIIGNLVLGDTGSNTTGSGQSGNLASIFNTEIDGALSFNKSLDLIWTTNLFGSSNRVSLTANSVGGVNGNMTINADTISLPLIRTITLYVVISVPNAFNGLVYMKIGLVTLDFYGGFLVLDTSVTSTSVITASVNGASSAGRIYVSSVVASFGFYINSTSGLADAGVKVGYHFGKPAI